MASPPQPTLVFAPGVKPNRCIAINYQCPTDPNLVNYILDILVNVARLYVRTDTTRASSTHDYISQIYPHLLSLYDQCVDQMLTHTGLEELRIINTPVNLTQQTST